MTQIPRAVLERFDQLQLGPRLLAIVPDLPAGLKAAVCHIESGCDPSIYNVYDKHGELRIGHWDLVPPTPRTYANSLLQILTKYSRGLTVREMFDLEKACGVIFPELMRFYRWAYDAGLRGADLVAATYAGHNRGAGNQKAASQRVKVATIEAWVAAMPYMPEKEKPRSLRVYKHVAELAELWSPIMDAIIPPAPPPEPIPVEDWHHLATWIPDEALCTLDPLYANAAGPQCVPPDLLVCLPDEGEMSYAAAPEDDS